MIHDVIASRAHADSHASTTKEATMARTELTAVTPRMVAEIMSGSKSSADQLLVAFEKMIEQADAGANFTVLARRVWADQPGPAAPILETVARELEIECRRCIAAMVALAVRLKPVLRDEYEDSKLDPDDVLARIGHMVPSKSDLEPS